ncbi:MAG: DUF4349 domain-containing protein [Bacteroidia bacterium]|nr:DUF4349 domain-containing protein [Bacteroidia bacterium]
MKSPLFRRAIWILALVFVVLFSWRMWYGYQNYSSTYFINSVNHSFFSGWVDLRSNYASKKYEMRSTDGMSTSQVSQKYEKVAVVESASTDFEKAEEKLRAEIAEKGAIIQFQKKTGNPGNRALHLMIGIQPDRFDDMYEALISKIGEIQSKEITKTDKTNEYKELNAQKASLEKIRNSLLALKSKGGKIEEYIQLENRILEIEGQLQGLGVQLGNYDAENEFCTIKFSLTEKMEQRISIGHRMKVALEWSLKIYLRILLSITLVLGIAYVGVLLVMRVRKAIGA